MPHPISKKQKIILKKIGMRFREIRKEKGLTLEQVGYAIGKDSQSIQRLESGNVNPSILYLIEVCKGLDIQVDELLNDL